MAWQKPKPMFPKQAGIFEKPVQVWMCRAWASECITTKLKLFLNKKEKVLN